MRGCITGCLLFVIITVSGIAYAIYEFAQQHNEPVIVLMEESEYNDLLYIEDRDVSELQSTDDDNRRNEIFEKLDKKQTLVFLTQSFLDKTLTVETLEGGALQGITVTNLIRLAQQINDHPTLAAHLLQFSPEITSVHDFENAIKSYRNTNYTGQKPLRGLTSSLKEDLVLPYMISTNLLYEDSSIVSDEYRSLEFGLATGLIEALQKDEEKNREMIESLMYAGIDYDYTRQSADLLKFWFNKLSRSSEPWKWELFNNMISYSDDDIITVFLENTSYITYSLGGLILNQHKEELLRFPTETRNNMRYVLERGIMSPYEWSIVSDLESTQDDMDQLLQSDPLTYYDILIEENPGIAEYYFSRAELRIENSGDYEGGMEDFDQALLLDPEYDQVYNYRAYYRSLQGKYALALRDYDTLISLDPDYDEAYYNRALMKNNLELYQEAIDDFNTALLTEPENRDIYFNRSISYAGLEDYSASIRDLKNCLSIDGYYLDAYQNLGYYQTLVESFDSARLTYQRMSFVDPGNIVAVEGIAYSYFGLKKYDSALYYYGKALELNESSNNYFYMAFIHGENGEYQKSLDLFRKSASLDTTFALAYYNCGWASEELNRQDSACHYYKLALVKGYEEAQKDVNRMCN